MRDRDGFTPSDLLVLDRPPHASLSLSLPTETFTWGDNRNSTLGHLDEKPRTAPEAVDTFRRSRISITSVRSLPYV